MNHKRYGVGYVRAMALAAVLLALGALQGSAAASPFGHGVFGADVPFGSATSLSIALGSNVSLTMAPSGGTFSGTGSHIVTVTSTDVVGYKLYVHALSSSDMTNGAATIPASGNGSAAPLSTNSWGYNTDGSANFLGMGTTSALLKDATGPYKNGDATTITYGAKADITKAAGDYTVSVVYTAVATNP